MPRININERMNEMSLDTGNFDPTAYTELQATQPEVAIESEPEKKGFLGRIADRFSERTSAGSEAFSKGISGEQSTASATLQGLGEGAGFVGDIGFEALKSLTPDFIEEAVGSVVTDVTEVAAQSEQIQSIVKWAEENPEAARNLEAVVNLGAIMPGVGALATKGTQAGVKASQKGVDAAKAGVSSIAKTRAVKASQKQIDETLNLTKPVLTKKEREAAIKAGNVEKIKGVIEPKATARDIERATVSAPFVDKNFIKMRDNLATEIKRISTDEIRPVLRQKVGAFNTNQIKKQLNDVEVPTAFKADATLENSYKLVRQRMLDVIDEHPNNLEGLYDARIKFDQILVDEFGDAAFDSQAAIKRAARDVRSQVNDYINTQVGDDLVKDALRRQSLMYESIDNLAAQNQKLFTTTNWQRWSRENPKQAAVIRMGGTALAGAGAYELVTP